MKGTKTEFSKWLLIQESALIWITTLAFTLLAFICVWFGYTGSLPWLSAMIGFPWAAYGVSQVYYYKKATVENAKNGIKYESVLAALDEAQIQNTTENISYEDCTEPTQDNIWDEI